jgi:NADH-quinone oxidoreductase subunit J
MSVMQIIFLVIGAVTLAAAVLVVTTRNMIRAALYLIVTLFGVAVLYVLLSAGFFAVVQVVVYIGAIAILFIFAVMLTRNLIMEKGYAVNKGWPLALLLAVVLFVGVFLALQGWSGFASTAPELVSDTATIEELGRALVSPDGYVIPFEVASVLLVAAMVGAIYVAWGRK